MKRSKDLIDREAFGLRGLRITRVDVQHPDIQHRDGLLNQYAGWDTYLAKRAFLMNRWTCGSKSLPVADVTSSSVHQREPRNSTWSRVISRLREPSLMNHKLTSVCPASSPTVVVTVTKAGVELSEKEASIPSSSRHSLRAVAAGCSSGSTWPPGGRNRPAFTWSTSKTSKFAIQDYDVGHEVAFR